MISQRLHYLRRRPALRPPICLPEILLTDYLPRSVFGMPLGDSDSCSSLGNAAVKQGSLPTRAGTPWRELLRTPDRTNGGTAPSRREFQDLLLHWVRWCMTGIPAQRGVPEKKGRGWRTKRKISHMGYLLIPPITDNKCKKEKTHFKQNNEKEGERGEGRGRFLIH